MPDTPHSDNLQAASERVRVACMISGGGRTLVNLADRADSADLPIEIALVIASGECVGVERARDRGLEVIIERGVIPTERLGELLAAARVEWLLLCGYLKLVRIPDGFAERVVNIHPALLPKFGGPGMYGDRVHRAVLEAGERESGCTVHLCDEEFDRGEIVLQHRCAVEPGDSVESLAARVFELEKRAYPEALRTLLARTAEAGSRGAGVQP